MRVPSLFLALLAACPSGAPVESPVPIESPAPVESPAPQPATEDACTRAMPADKHVCSLGDLQACCAHRIRHEPCADGMKCAGAKVASDPCTLDCAVGEAIVDLCPNCDERRLGCVACN